ncbi:MAG: methyltransferase domain-containing protein [Candidatus Bathyarchaeia archaeon]
MIHELTKPHSRLLLLTSEVAGRILRGENRVSLDLGLSETIITLEGDLAFFPDGSRVSLESLGETLEHPNTVFILLDSEPHPVALSDGHYYKLVPTSGAPTLEIDGVRMHRTKGTTPEADAREKVRALGMRGGRVLEVGTGLGYTAQMALDAGADLVVSIELNPAVLKIARVNPWSRRIFVDERVHLILGDAYNILGSLHPGLFDYIIHDPPRFSLAGHLYGSAFYAELFRALRGGGRLFHYIGEPGSRYRGRNLRRGVTNRLRGIGFVNPIYHENVKGLTCMKSQAS